MGERDTSLGRNGRRITWGQSGTLVTNDSSRVVTMQTGDLTDTEFRYYTLQFNAQGPDNNGGFQATAIVTFMVNGIPTVRMLTVGQGVEISGPAESISVRLVDSTPAAWANSGQKYTVSVVCAPGTRANNVLPILNDTGGNFSAGTGVYQFNGPAHQSVAVPPNAGINGFWFTFNVNTPEASAAGVATVSQTATNGAVCWDGTVTASVPVWIPLMPGATVVSIFCPGDEVSMLFTIAWTVDG